MTMPMTVAEMRAELTAYKRKSCPPTPKTKAGLIKVLSALNLRVTKTKKGALTKYGMPEPKKNLAKSTLTKKQLIDKITSQNGRHKSVYNDWSKKDLEDFISGGM